MLNNFFPFSLSFVFILLVSFFSFAQSDSLILFVDDFESLTAGQQLVCQDSLNWNTWSSLPCDPTEDPYVTNATAHNGSNSVWIQQNNDFIKRIPDYTWGKYSIRFYLYIPTNYTASWGQLASFISPDSTEWGFVAKFDPFGYGNVVAGASSAQFSFSYDMWMHNELIVDLNKDSAEYYFEDNLIHSWQWSLAIWGDTCTRQLSVTDIMGSDWPLPDSSQWYIDDFVVERLDTTVGVKDFSVLTEFALEQNYPNPFNPTTKINYQIPELSFVTIKVFDVLGGEVATLISEEKSIGSYEIEFNSHSGSVRNLPSGIYFYQIQAGRYVETKKMVLLR